MTGLGETDAECLATDGNSSGACTDSGPSRSNAFDQAAVPQMKSPSGLTQSASDDLDLQMNPNGKIPVLVTPGGHAMFESNAICRFLGNVPEAKNAATLYPAPASGEVRPACGLALRACSA